MSQIIENRSDIDGVVEDVSERERGDVTMYVRVHAAHPVGEMPNLLSDEVGAVIAIRVRDASALPPAGAIVSLRVRKAGLDRFYADEGSLRIT